MDAEALYAQAVKGRWRKVQGLPWKAVPMKVELNLSQDKKNEPDWRKAKLLLVRSLKTSGEAEVGQKNWALFLTTDVRLSVSKRVQLYALRWGIEVYFKEAKQHPGLLTEQTRTFAAHTASIHLGTIRYMMLVHVRELFRAIISGTLRDIEKDLGCSVPAIMPSIDDRVSEFFVQSLQLDSFTLRMEDG